MHIRAEDLQELLRLDLYEAGWTDSGNFPGQTKRQITMNSLANSFLKKFHNEEVSEERNDKALALFLQCNEQCRSFDAVVPQSLIEELVVGEMKSIIYDFFNPIFLDKEGFSTRHPFTLNLSDIASCFGLGNGANIGSDSTNFYTKFVNSSMSHTSSILPLLFRQAISTDRLWTDIEVSRSKYSVSEMVSGSRLSFVPKSSSISRTICTEPLLNMLFQKGIAGVLERRLNEVFSIDLSSQPSKNAALAQIGSVDGRFGTIDLSSASDTISISLLVSMLPAEPLDWLLRCRSPFTTLPSGESIELHMISSMGNGYTFPLQTMLFACLVKAVYRVLDIPFNRPSNSSLGNFAVFGDDIIVDTRAYALVVKMLSRCGFSVNLDKSFNEGLFRESCGSDFYSGYNVRGIYIKKLISSGDFYSAINRLNRWSAKHGILLCRVISHLRRGCRFLGVPFDEADDAGIKIPESLIRNIRRDINGAITYLALVNAARVVRIPSVDADLELSVESLALVRRLLPNFRYDSDGLLFCLLAGWLRSGSLGIKSLQPKSVLRRRKTPGWESYVVAQGVSPEFYRKWKFTVEANLVSWSYSNTLD